MVVIPCAGLVLPNLQYIDPSVSGLKDVGAQLRELLFKIGSSGPPVHYFSNHSLIFLFTNHNSDVHSLLWRKMIPIGWVEDMEKEIHLPKNLGRGSYPPKYLEEVWPTC